MAGYFKKRRNTGPSKNEEKVARHQESERKSRSAGSLGARFPSVEKLKIHLDIHSPQKLLLSQETRAFGAGDPCNFSVPCPGRCGAGSFDLAAKIEQVVTSQQAQSASSGVCKQPLYAGASEICGCELQCRIEIVYAPKPEPPAVPATPIETAS